MLHSYEQGDRENPCLFFLHGFMGNSGEWKEIINHFSDKYYCLAIDLPGHGYSTGCEYIKTFEDLANNISDILNDKNISQCTLIGYSMGARCAISFASKYPKKINAMVLESGSLGIRDDQDKQLRVASDHSLIVLLRTVEFGEFIRKWYKNPLFGKISQHSDYEALINERLNNDLQGLMFSLRYFGTGVMPDFYKQWITFSFPILLLAGENDFKYKYLNREMEEQNLNSELVEVEGAAHNIHFEKREKFINYVESFLNKIKN